MGGFQRRMIPLGLPQWIWGRPTRCVTSPQHQAAHHQAHLPDLRSPESMQAAAIVRHWLLSRVGATAQLHAGAVANATQFRGPWLGSCQQRLWCQFGTARSVFVAQRSWFRIFYMLYRSWAGLPSDQGSECSCGVVAFPCVAFWHCFTVPKGQKEPLHAINLRS